MLETITSAAITTATAEAASASAFRSIFTYYILYCIVFTEIQWEEFTMPVYEPSPELTKAVLAGIAAPLPFIAGTAFKVVPFKEKIMSGILAYAIPMSIGAIASTQVAGARITLTRHGELTEEVKRGLLKRIAAWFIPNEVRDVTAALQADIITMAKSGYAEDAWRLEATAGEVVLVVINTSLIKVSADTVVDMFFNSVDGLKKLKDKLPFMGAK